MKRIKVQSSTIAEIGYDIESKVLEVQFVKGTIYRYDDFGVISLCHLLFADSIGSYFMKNVAKVYNYEKVEK